MLLLIIVPLVAALIAFLVPSEAVRPYVVAMAGLMHLATALSVRTGDTRGWLAGSIRRDEWNGGNAAEMHLEDAALA